MTITKRIEMHTTVTWKGLASMALVLVWGIVSGLIAYQVLLLAAVVLRAVGVQITGIE